MSRKRVYLDYASTTPLDPRVLKAMLPYFGKKFGNPSSIHAPGVEAKKALDESRKSVASMLQARESEIIFTSGGTESNNLAIFGIISAAEIADRRGTNAGLRGSRERYKLGKIHIVTTNIEHSSVLEPIRELERRGVSVTYVPVRPNGIVDPKKIAAALRPETVLVSVGYANNEIGTIQPIREISKIVRAHSFQTFKLLNFQTRFHSDGSQAPLYLDCNVSRLGVDLLTLDGHKMYGPKGVGLLYVKEGVELSPIIFGGGQERGLRSTTENIPLIVGLSKAFEIASRYREKESKRLTRLRDYFYSSVLQKTRIENVVINGDMKERLPNNVNISIPGLDVEFATLKLDAAGIACSTKSSCLGSSGGSYVVRALGLGEARAFSTLRFTFGRDTTKPDIDYLVKVLAKIT